MRRVPPALYHYTCDHGHSVLGQSGTLLPGSMLVDEDVPLPWPSQYLWLTDLDVPRRNALGLTQHVISCDRTQYRYRATNTTTTVRWLALTARDHHLAELGRVLTTRGADPRHWWVSTEPVPAVYDPLEVTA